MNGCAVLIAGGLRWRDFAFGMTGRFPYEHANGEDARGSGARKRPRHGPRREAAARSEQFENPKYQDTRS